MNPARRLADWGRAAPSLAITVCVILGIITGTIVRSYL